MSLGNIGFIAYSAFVGVVCVLFLIGICRL